MVRNTQSFPAPSREQLRVQTRAPPTTQTHHNRAEVVGLKLGDGHVDGLDEAGAEPLCEQGVEVDGAAQQLHVTLLQDGLVAVRAWVGKLVWGTLHSETLVQVYAVGQRVGVLLSSPGLNIRPGSLYRLATIKAGVLMTTFTITTYIKHLRQ